MYKTIVNSKVHSREIADDVYVMKTGESTNEI